MNLPTVIKFKRIELLVSRAESLYSRGLTTTITTKRLLEWKDVKGTNLNWLESQSTTFPLNSGSNIPGYTKFHHVDITKDKV